MAVHKSTTLKNHKNAKISFIFFMKNNIFCFGFEIKYDCSNDLKNVRVSVRHEYLLTLKKLGGTNIFI